MIRLIEAIAARFRTHWSARRDRSRRYRALALGLRVYDGEPSHLPITIPSSRRAEYVAVLGKTGTGKSFLLRFLLKQDIEARRGFVCFDLHGDLTCFIIGAVATEERRSKRDLSGRLTVIDPSDEERSVGLNPLEEQNGAKRRSSLRATSKSVPASFDVIFPAWKMAHCSSRRNAGETRTCPRNPSVPTLLRRRGAARSS